MKKISFRTLLDLRRPLPMVAAQYRRIVFPSRDQKERSAVVFVMVLALLLNGCMVGPKYKTPTAPVPGAFKEAPPASFKEGDGWKTAQPGDQTIRGNWWELFGDTQLNALEQQLTLGNQDLKAAEARFREARAMIKYNRASLFPTISTAPSITSERVSSNRPFFTTQPPASGDFVLPF